MNTKNNQRYKAGSEKIETAFLSLLYNKKYEEITIKEICERAEINRSTFYAHYDDINQLIITIEKKFSHSVSSIFNYGLRWDNHAFEEMFAFIKENKYFYLAFLNIPYVTIAENDAKIHALTNIRNNNEDIHSGDMKLYYRASFFGAGIKEMCRLWLENDCKESPKDMANILLDEYAGRRTY